MQTALGSRLLRMKPMLVRCLGHAGYWKRANAWSRPAAVIRYCDTHFLSWVRHHRRLQLAEILSRS